jgi:hypothetical protein
MYVAQSSQFNSEILKISIQGGQPFSKFWDWQHDNTSWWDAKPIAPVLIRALTKLGVIKPRRWSTLQHLDDPGFWQGAPLDAQALQNLAAGGRPTSALWTWDFDDPGPWGFTSQNAPIVVTGALASNKPFFDNWWRWHHDDAAVWSGSPLGAKPLMPLLGQVPNIPRFWRNDYDDAAPWLAQSIDSELLTALLVAGGPPFKPRFWRQDHDDAAPWLASPFKSYPLSVTAPAVAPFIPRFWKADHDDSSFWSVREVARDLPMLLSYIGNLPLLKTELIPGSQLFAYDEQSVWPWKAPFQEALIAYLLIQNVKPFSKQWEFLDDDSAPWNGMLTPKGDPVVRYLTQFTPIKPPRWKFDYDETGMWLASPIDSQALQNLVIGGKPTSALWTWDFDEGGLWVPSSRAPSMNIRQLNPATLTFTAKFWKFGQDDSSVWTGNPMAAPPLRPLLTVGGQVPTKRWEPVYRYDVDAAAWETTRRENLILLKTPIPNPIIPRQWRWDHMLDEPLWVKGPESAFVLNVPRPPPVAIQIDRLLMNFGTRVRTLADNHTRVRLLANTRPRRDEV